MQVGFETVAAVNVCGGVVEYLLQVVGIDACHLIVACVILAVGLIKIHLSQEGGSGSFRGATLLGLHGGEYGVGSFQVVDDLLPTFIVGVLCVREIVIVILRHVQLVHKRNLLEQALQLEVAVGAEEPHLGGTLLDSGVLLVGAGEDVERQADTRQVLVELVPDGVEGPVAGVYANAHLKAVERLAVAERTATYVGIVGAGVVVPE